RYNQRRSARRSIASENQVWHFAHRIHLEDKWALRVQITQRDLGLGCIAAVDASRGRPDPILPVRKAVSCPARAGGIYLVGANAKADPDGAYVRSVEAVASARVVVWSRVSGSDSGRRADRLFHHPGVIADDPIPGHTGTIVRRGGAGDA